MELARWKVTGKLPDLTGTSGIAKLCWCCRVPEHLHVKVKWRIILDCSLMEVLLDYFAPIMGWQQSTTGQLRGDS